MDAKKWFTWFCIEIFAILLGISSIVIFVDPYFHYHKPVSSMFYVLNNQRSQNDGMIKHFEYDSIITGTSMCENFKTSEFDEIFLANSIKVCFSGGSYKEISTNLEKAFESGHNVKYILRCLDYSMLITDKDKMRFDLGKYPIYLYDKNVFNDLKYILNKEIIYDICTPMLVNAYLYKEAGGITSFDEYSNWNEKGIFGAESVLGDKREYIKAESDIEFTDEDREIVKETIDQNVIRLAKAHPQTTFYYFFPPYSIIYWGDLYEHGILNRQIDAERIAIEQMLKCENIRLYSFNNHWDITTNLNNYKDSLHYGEWINTKILHMIHENTGRLTKDNYEEYIDRERDFYSNYIYKFDIVKNRTLTMEHLR